VSTAADTLAAFGPVETKLPPAPPIVASRPPPASAPALDRWQLLSTSLSRCAGGDPFARAECERVAQAKYCDGYWGQSALCPAGIPNDHGQ
jgi:hypothetical protein